MTSDHTPNLSVVATGAKASSGKPATLTGPEILAERTQV
jgi:hypothetical protein